MKKILIYILLEVWAHFVFFIFIFTIAGIPLVYSYVIYRKLPETQKP